MNSLEDILEQSRQLHVSLRQLQTHPNTTTLRYAVNEIAQQTHLVVEKHHCDNAKAQVLIAETPCHTDLDSRYLLSRCGTDPDYTNNTLNSIELQDVISSTTSKNNDVTSYIRQVRERGILMLINDRRRQAETDFHLFIEENLAGNWANRTNALLRHYKASRESSASGGQRYSDRETEVAPKDRKLSIKTRFQDIHFRDDAELAWTAKEQTFSQAISSLNEHRLMKQPVAISSLMSQLTRSLGSQIKVHQLADSWQMLSFIINERHIEYEKVTAGELVKQRQYTQEYALGPQSKSMKRMIVDGSRRYLENQFYTFMEREIARNPHQARLGGTPSAESKAKAFVNLQLYKNGIWALPNMEMINNVPIWAVIFYLIRAGQLSDVMQYSKKNETAISRIEKNWCTYIAAYAAGGERKLPRQLADRLHSEYNLRLKFSSNDVDPFKQAVYKIIGRCDLAQKTLSNVLPVTEDWLWSQLCLVHDSETSDIKCEKYDLDDLQSIILQYGEQHFNSKGTNPLLYLQILLLSGQFERAVHYLCNHSFTDAVHIAIVLAYYGLLRVNSGHSDDEDNLLYDNPDNGRVELNFSSLVASYARGLQSYSSTAAVEYIALMCLNVDLPSVRDAEVSKCHTTLRSLILESRDYALLLGDIKADGSREPGFIERRLSLLELYNEKQYLRTISEQAASVSEREGRISDAILLYHLSEEYDVVVGLINNSLGESLFGEYAQLRNSPSKSSNIEAENPARLARNMLAIYKENVTIFSAVRLNNKDNCSTLLAIVDAQTQSQCEQYDNCLATIDHTGLIPLSENLTVGMIKEKAQNFDVLDGCVARNVPHVLLLCAKCMRAKFELLRRGEYNDQFRRSQMQGLKAKAKNLSIFAGLIKYQIAEDVRLELESVLVFIR